jgi:hypothetical protein
MISDGLSNALAIEYALFLTTAECNTTLSNHGFRIAFQNDEFHLQPQAI